MSSVTRYIKNKLANAFQTNSNQTPEGYVYKVADYDATYVHLNIVLKLCGFRINKKDSEFASFCWDAFYWFKFINMSIIAGLLLVNIVLSARQGTMEDAVAIFRMAPACGYFLLANVKSYKIVRCRPLFENLISELRSMWPRGVVSREEHDIISSSLTPLFYFVKGIFCCYMTIPVGYFAPLIVTYVKHVMFGDEVQLSLLYPIWLPFDPFQSGYYEIVLAFEIFHGFVLAWFVLSGYLSMFIFLRHLTTQFHLLSFRITRFINVPYDRQLIATYPLGITSDEYLHHNKTTLNDTQWDDIHQKELAEIIRRHQALIRLAGDVESIFSFPLLVVFFTSSIFICLFGFCTVVIEKWNEITYKTFLLSSLLQTWVFCWIGEGLIQSSAGIADSVYSCGWYHASNKVQRSLLIMLQRSQKEVCITTYGFSAISLITFTKIIKTSWSYLSLLLSFYN